LVAEDTAGNVVQKVEQLDIPEVLLITPTRHLDSRGFFSEVFRRDAWTESGISAEFVQENHVHSASAGVLRGLHFQVGPNAQGKLVRCSRGAILDVAVDVRSGSPTFGQHVKAVLSAENWLQIWVPIGFAHGYVTLEPDCEVIYKTTAYYDPGAERGIAWDDPALGIDWRFAPSNLTLSAKDTRHPRLAEAEVSFVFPAAGA
jgi:dTDP-4-dehydrorhamnose 3,5-epimerase